MIVKVSDYVEAYGARARYTRDVHELDGRGGRRILTRFVNQNICEEVGLKPSDKLLDIGCGDGSLLTLAAEKGTTHALGLLGTEAEVVRLRELGLNVLRGLTDNLPVTDASANVVVCNSVLHIVPREKIPSSLSEIVRVAEADARIWLGEIPQAAEQEGVPRHESVTAMLSYLLRERGVRTFLGMCRRLIWSSIRGEPIILNTAKLIQFWAEPDEFIRMAAQAGLTLVRYFPHRELDPQGVVTLSQNRFDYIFTKTVGGVRSRP